MQNQPLRKLSSLTLPWPADWGALFGESRPLILEIGFGYGHFLEHLSKQNPEANLVGIEISNECLMKVENAIPRKGLNNVRVIYSRAETALHHLFEPETISQIHINFPDPWFKIRHVGRRLMQRDTLDAMVNRLSPSGMLYLATDILDYAEMSAELLAATPGLSNTLATPWENAMPGRVITKYERKAQIAGRACYYFAYQRNDTPAPFIPVTKELDMPHIVLKTSLTPDEITARFSESEQTQNDTSIHFLYAYRGVKTVLFEAYIREPTIDQRLALVLVEREEHPGEYTLKLSSLGNPRPTDGVHQAVWLLANWVVGLHPDAAILQSKVRIFTESA